MYTLTITFQTKIEAKEAVKRGDLLHIVRPDGTVLTSANGSNFPITGKLAHYKEWRGEASVWNGKVTRVK